MITVAPAHVLYLNPTAQLGGAEYSLLDLAASLDRSRFTPLVVCLGEGPLVAAAEARELPVVALPLPHRVARLSLKGERSSALGLGAAAVSVAPLLRRVRALARRAAIVHTNGNKAHVLGGLVGGSAPLVWHVRDFWSTGFSERCMIRLGNLRTSAIIANSHAMRAHLVQMGMRETLVHAVPNGIDSERFTTDGEVASLRAELGWPAHAPVIGIVGMLARWKGQDVLLRAFAEVLRRRPDARCVIVGDEIYVTRGQTGYSEELRELLRRLNLESAVALTGYRTDVPAVLRALDVVVHASVEPEPFGRVVAEAMACARPVIATDAGGVPEITGPDGASALLVPPGDEAALSAAILRLLNDPVEAGRIGTAGRERVRGAFSVARHVDRVQAIYEQLLPSVAPAVTQPAAGSVR